MHRCMNRNVEMFEPNLPCEVLTMVTVNIHQQPYINDIITGMKKNYLESVMYLVKLF